MPYLLLVSIIWGLSIPLVKGQLTGLDPFFLGFARMALALPIFLPFLAWRRVQRSLALRLAGIGAVQYGLMYVCLFMAFHYLPAYQVALFTVTTPLFVALMARELMGRRLLWALGAALLAILGAAIIQYDGHPPGLDSWTGFFLMQASNAAFAFGQVAYRQLRPAFSGFRDREVYVWLYAGAALITLPFALIAGGFASAANLTWHSGLTLVYLGVVASGLCFFWWNRGATKTRPATLAVFNNLKIPFAMLFAFTLFGEEAPLVPFIVGSTLLLGALLLAESTARRRS